MKKLITLLFIVYSFGSFSQATSNTLVVGTTTDITGTSTTQVIPATASKKINVTQLTISNSHATQGTWVNIRSNTTIILTVFAIAGGGATINFPQESPLRCGSGEALIAICETSGANVRVSASGFKQ